MPSLSLGLGLGLRARARGLVVQVGSRASNLLDPS